MFKHILVAVDGSATAQRGLESAIRLAADQRAVLHLVHVVDYVDIPPGFDGTYVPADYLGNMMEALRGSGRSILDKAQSLARERGVEAFPTLVETHGQTVAHAILQQVRKQKADLIVMGTHGRRGVRRLLMGSDGEAVLRDSRVPVLLVRSAEPAHRARAIRRDVVAPVAGSRAARKPSRSQAGGALR